jgi:hypothetical protein
MERIRLETKAQKKTAKRAFVLGGGSAFSCLAGLPTTGRNGEDPTESLKTEKVSTRIKPIPMFIHLADHTISFIWQSCCGERAESHANLNKIKS